jgi:SAM-dependent methyltransferase
MKRGLRLAGLSTASDSEPERLDRGVSPAEAEVALRDLERVYRLLLAGGRGLRRAVLANLGSSSRPWLLDVGAGGGHVAADLQRDAAAHGLSIRVIGVDAKLSHLLAGRRFDSPQQPLVADAMTLPIRDGALACAFSHLFFHHFDADGNRRVLAEMRRVARQVVVVDLRRGLVLLVLVRPVLRLLGLGEVAYEDGVVSAERSYTKAQVAAVSADVAGAELRRCFPFRWLLRLPGSAG